jgi:YD repeat-containing protein
MLYGLTFDGVDKLGYAYDGLGRLTSRTAGPGLSYLSTYRYVDNTDGSTTTLLAGITNGAEPEMSYTYDGSGNITEVCQGSVLTRSYAYDALDQLVRADDADAQQSTTYTYDGYGNILTVTRYPYSVGTLGTAIEHRVYRYEQPAW